MALPKGLRNLVTKPFFLIFILFCCLFFITLFVSQPGWRGDFWLDDSQNITKNPAVHITQLNLDSILKASFSSHAGPTNRPVSMFSFALNHYFFSLNAFSFKVINSIIHGLNGFLLFLLSYKLLRLSPIHALNDQTIVFLAFFMSLFWLITPIHIANSLYVVQRMNLLATFFVLLGSLTYVLVRTQNNYSRTIQFLFALLFLFLLTLAALSKENGILLLVFALIIDYSFRCQGIILYNKQFFLTIGLTLIILLISLSFIILHVGAEEIVSSFDHRNFTLTERLLTQPRVLVMYLQQTLFPNIHQLTLFHDDYVKSTGFFSPIATVVTMIFFTSIGLISFYLRKTYTWLFLGFFWFMAGHAMESSILPLELVYEHRNYLPSFGIIFFLTISIYLLAKKLNTSKLLLIVPVAYLVFLAFNSYIISSIWGSTLLLVETNSTYHPNSAHSQLMLGKIRKIQYQHNPVKTQYYDDALTHFQLVSKLDDNSIAGLVQTIDIKLFRNQLIEKEKKLLLKRMQTMIPDSNLAISIQNLIEIALRHKQILDENYIRQTLTTIRNNNKISNRLKASALTRYASYYYTRFGQTSDVIDLYQKAIAFQPQSIKLKLTLTNMLISIQQYNKALAILNSVKQHPKAFIHQSEIDSLNSILRDAIKTLNK